MEPGNQWFVTGSADRTIKVSKAENKIFFRCKMEKTNQKRHASVDSFDFFIYKKNTIKCERGTSSLVQT